ncbi:primosomal protein N' [Candidatus Omnitrophota bacterium]
MIAEVVVGLEIRKSFDYDAKGFKGLKKGMRVLVDFNRRQTVAFVVGTKRTAPPGVALKPLLEILDRAPAFGPGLLAFSKAISQRYLYSRGDILEMMLPLTLRGTQQLDVEAGGRFTQSRPPFEAAALYIREHLGGSRRFLRYLEEIEACLGAKRKVIICVPQVKDLLKISQLLTQRLPAARIATLSGAQKASVQFQEWVRIRRDQADICLGTRTAIFAPFNDVGLIIVEKENYYGYFQPVKPFYHLRDLALMRAAKEKSGIILHSDFPSLEVHQLIKHGAFASLDLVEENQPRTKIFDLKDYRFRRYPLFSDLIQEVMRKYLEAGKRVIVFWNRKGFSRILRCQSCSLVLKCPKCASFLVFSLDNKAYLCPKCVFTKKAKSRCPKCGRGYIRNVGTGIERIESRFQKNFPDKRIVKLSKDHRLERSDWDILISTQKIVFMPDLPRADLLVVAGLDLMHSSNDFTSSLELFFLLRRLKRLASEELILFTYNPDSAPVQGLTKDWRWFYEVELKARRSLKFPPYFPIAKVVLRQKEQGAALKNITALKRDLEANAAGTNVDVYGPLEDEPFKSGGKFRYLLVIKAGKQDVLRTILDKTIRGFKKSSAKISLIIQ